MSEEAKTEARRCCSAAATADKEEAEAATGDEVADATDADGSRCVG